MCVPPSRLVDPLGLGQKVAESPMVNPLGISRNMVDPLRLTTTDHGTKPQAKPPTSRGTGLQL